MLVSNDLKPKEKTSYCIGYPVNYNGKPAHIISYKSVHIGFGRYEIKFARLCFPKKEVVKGNTITKGVIIKAIDIDNITLRII